MEYEQKLRYLAGYIDGDGCFRVNIGAQKSGTIVYERSITVTSTCKDSIKFFHETLGGFVFEEQKPGNRRKTYCWTVKSKSSYFTALDLRDFLISKKTQCKLFIQYCENIDASNYQKVSIENIDKRNEFVSKIRDDIHNFDLINRENIEFLKNQENMINPTDEDFIYFAGLVDAEGCFRIVKRFRKSSNSFIYNTELAIGNVKYSIIEWLYQRFGGSISFQQKQHPSRNIACWSIHAKSLIPIIKRIENFLIVKKEVCQELIKFQKTILPNGGKRSSEKFKEFFKTICRERDLIVDKVHLLNHRGL